MTLFHILVTRRERGGRGGLGSGDRPQGGAERLPRTAEELRTDPRQLKSPYLFLYKGYERQWASYKSFVTVLKLLLVPTVLLPNLINAKASALVVLQSVFAMLISMTIFCMVR